MWEVYGFCECGFKHKPSFGDLWFMRQSYPICPKCGESCYKYERKVMRYVQPIFKGKWWNPFTWNNWTKGYWEVK